MKNRCNTLVAPEEVTRAGAARTKKTTPNSGGNLLGSPLAVAAVAFVAVKTVFRRGQEEQRD